MSKLWDQEDISFLKENYMVMSHAEIAKKIGRTKRSVTTKCWRLGLRKEEPVWTDEEIQLLKKYYSGEHLILNDIEKKLNRTRIAISIKARQLGLTKYGWPLTEEQKKRISENTKRYIKESGHPKGMLGKTHSDEFKKIQSKRVKEMWKDPNARVNSEEFRRKRSETMSMVSVTRLRNNPQSLYSRGKSGFREDLGFYVRSRWEANYARYLIFLREKGSILDFEYEPDTYWFENIKRGTRSYTPDFKVWTSPNKYEYHEVKGYMDQKSKTKLKRMKKYYPNETVLIIAREEYNEIKKWSTLIPNWEEGA